MYAIPNVSRIYTTLFLCLCAALLFAPSVANSADGGYWSTQERRFISQNQVNNRVNNILTQSVQKPSNSTLSTAPSAPTITKNAAGGLSASTNQILKTMGQPSTFSSTSNFSLNSAKNALKSCVRSPSCAGRTLGGGAIIYDGINAWKDVYDMTLGDDGTPHRQSPENPVDYPPAPDDETGYIFVVASGYYTDSVMPADSFVVATTERNNRAYNVTCTQTRNSLPFYSFRPHSLGPQNGGHCFYTTDLGHETPIPSTPVPLPELDQMIDEGYEPAESDAPIVLLSDTPPATIEISTPAPAQLPSETRTDTSSAGTTTTVTNRTINYTVNNNNTANPSISSSVTETSTTYDENSNVVNTSTSTTENPAVAPDPPTAGASADFELPVFCTWAKPLCDWLGWTQEGIEGEEPDLINLISEFEPDEHEYNSGIGSGSCPAPMSLNLGIINRTVEVSYQPFCDFLDMIRPLVIAGAWLLSAFMYVGVLRRG